MTYPSNEPEEGIEVSDAERLVELVENIEKAEADKRSIAGDIKAFYAEVKDIGYDARVLRKLIALRKRDPDDVAEEAEILALYKQTLGMS